MTSFNPRRRWTAWLRWPDEERGPYHVGLTWSGTEDGRAQLVGVEVWSRPPGSERVMAGPEGDLADIVAAAPAISGRLLHDLPLSRIARQARQALLAGFRAESGPGRGRRREAARRAAQGLSDGPSTAGRLDRGFFEEIAGVYRDAVVQGLNPYQAIRDRWAASSSTVAHWVSRARHEHGLLPRTSRGRTAI